MTTSSTGSDPGAMALIPGGEFAMGSERFYREERPVHVESVEPFEAPRPQGQAR